ncbi:MAG TPA: helix-turn-helix transcriptional regulator [Pyrinomonadaceae bacterium]|nr:helix-turn-helix transcriptional regulator [Pyrinomonadaceae bacterium]
MQARRLQGPGAKQDRMGQGAQSRLGQTDPPPDRRRLLMGNPRPKPLRLAEKLLEIRKGLGLSQTQMLTRMGLEESMHYGRISEYEQGKREPTLMTLLAYARSASVHLEDIVDDDLELPRKLPGNVNYRGLTRKSRRK